jgi:hypothetical protein
MSEMEINFWTVAVSIASAITVAIINYFSLKKLKKVELKNAKETEKEKFKNLHYEIILKRRNEAYENIFRICDSLSKIRIDGLSGTYIHSIFLNIENFENFKRLLSEAILSAVFLSNGTKEAIKEVNSWKIKLAVTNTTEPAVLNETGIVVRKEVDAMKIKLSKIAFKEYQSLYKIDDFFNNSSLTKK